MLIKFKSLAHGDVIMFGDVALQLIKLMGRRGTVPSAINPEDIPEALESLQQALQLTTMLKEKLAVRASKMRSWSK
jgi:hypothetical protein